MTLSSAGELNRAEKEEANTVTQFAPKSQLSGHREAWQCPALGGRLRRWPLCMDGLGWHKRQPLGGGPMTYRYIVQRKKQDTK